MGVGEMGLMCDGGLGACAVRVLFGAMFATAWTALAHEVVCCRNLSSSQISTIANGAFAELTALTRLYDAGCGLGMLLLCVCMDVGAHFPGLISGLLPFTILHDHLMFACFSRFPDLHMQTYSAFMGHRFIPFFVFGCVSCV
jgi:hypothetical protein